ncbi:MAG: hypothetical protein ACT443_08835 [Gemmatimonadota bacterium]
MSKSMLGVELRSARSGAAVNLRSGRGPILFLCVHAPDCQGCADLIRKTRNLAELDEWGARLMVVVGGPLESATRLQQSVADAVDVYAGSERAICAQGGKLIITDQWGEIYDELDFGEAHQLPADEIGKSLQFIAIQCPECEGPEGGWRSL